MTPSSHRLEPPTIPGRFTYEYPQFLKDQRVTLSMSAVGHRGDNTSAEGLWGMLKRERINRRRYRTLGDARTDVFDHIERFHNPRIQPRARLSQ